MENMSTVSLKDPQMVRIMFAIRNRILLELVFRCLMS